MQKPYPKTVVIEEFAIPGEPEAVEIPEKGGLKSVCHLPMLMYLHKSNQGTAVKEF